MKPSELSRERWRRIDQVFDAALQTPAAERADLLDDLCAGDDDLRREVDALLDAHRRADPHFDTPVSPLGAALVTSPEPAPIGRRVGPFRILDEIGRGGMGVVYLAEDTRLGRKVALKVLPPYLGTGPRARRRFATEARAVSALDHPNIATLYESDATDEGQLYMVFAFYEGETLQERIRRGPLPPAEAVTIATGIAEGLAAAHRNGIIHRDVKPSNVLLSDGSEVKLLDFGVARIAGEEVTATDARLGTVAYMSPEQAGGEPLDERTDLWSLGVVLYEMVTGTRPFRDADPPVLLQSILHDAPRPFVASDPEPPEPVQRVIGKLLGKRPGDRYQHAGELLTDLRALRAGEVPPLATRYPPASRTRRSAAPRWRRSLVALAGLALVASGVWLALGRPPAVPQVGRLAVLPLVNLTDDSARQYVAAGIQDALITELGRLGTVDVLSRASVMPFRDTTLSLAEIAGALNVDAVVTGSVLPDGDSLTVTAQLITAAPERHLWGATYRRGVAHVAEITRDVARAVATAIRIAPPPRESLRLARPQPVNPAAWDAYVMGQFSIESRRRQGFEQAQRYFRRAIAIDSTFAPAYAALAEAFGEAAFFGLWRPSEMMPRVRALAEKALSLDSGLAEAEASLAAVQLYWDWDWTGAERRARHAIALNPSLPLAHRILAEVLAVRGRYDGALASIEHANQLDRFAQFSAFMPIVMLYYKRDYDEAMARLEAALEFFPDFWQGHWLLCLSLAGKGRYDAAVPACEDAAQRSNRNPMALGALGYVLAMGGRHAEALQVAHELEELARHAYVGGAAIAGIYGALGDRDRAFRWLEQAVQERDVRLVHLHEHVFFDPLRDDPRMARVATQVGFASPYPGSGGGRDP